MKFKADGESRLQEEKRAAERRRNIFVLISKHLINSGYIDAATALQRECNLGLEKWEVADNIDLYYIVQDFEEYYEMKFLRKPVLTRKGADDAFKKCKFIIAITFIAKALLPKFAAPTGSQESS
jgi:katanin p60 ATPase-containing subunit A1